jgi:hypothetical protein
LFFNGEVGALLLSGPVGSTGLLCTLGGRPSGASHRLVSDSVLPLVGNLVFSSLTKKGGLFCSGTVGITGPFVPSGSRSAGTHRIADYHSLEELVSAF